MGTSVKLLRDMCPYQRRLAGCILSLIGVIFIICLIFYFFDDVKVGDARCPSQHSHFHCMHDQFCNVADRHSIPYSATVCTTVLYTSDLGRSDLRRSCITFVTFRHGFSSRL
ncbi:hypothetical protein GJ496_008399 [Pomphorhynchus laevis]|nr:hypothetical protein GJ496_008399 [Pomphorhynchus laevis]